MGSNEGRSIAIATGRCPCSIYPAQSIGLDAFNTNSRLARGKVGLKYDTT